MLKKIERSKLFLADNLKLFQCPICHKSMEMNQQGLICDQNHRFDLSKKGTLYFLDHQVKTDYNRQLFLHRGAMIKSGMYQPLIDFLVPFCSKKQVLDIGCGEGSFLNELAQKADLSASIGFDISKEGIYLATEQPSSLFWCVADLTNLPFQQQVFSTILNIFSPSNYQEFDRVLCSGGQVIKVVPGQKYLQELRAAFYPEDQAKQTYSNERVIANFQRYYSNMETHTLEYVFEVPQTQQMALLEMSPLEWGVSTERKALIQENPLEKITVELEILIGQKF